MPPMSQRSAQRSLPTMVLPWSTMPTSERGRWRSWVEPAFGAADVKFLLYCDTPEGDTRWAIERAVPPVTSQMAPSDFGTAAQGVTCWYTVVGPIPRKPCPLRVPIVVSTSRR